MLPAVCLELHGRPVRQPAAAADSTSRRQVRAGRESMKQRSPDPAQVAVIGHALHSVAVEMGVALRRTAFSPNIKERRDYSCAIYDSRGDTVAMGDHMPVHLGAMPLSVQAALRRFDLERGDVAIVNDPFQ